MLFTRAFFIFYYVSCLDQSKGQTNSIHKSDRITKYKDSVDWVCFVQLSQKASASYLWFPFYKSSAQIQSILDELLASCLLQSSQELFYSRWKPLVIYYILVFKCCDSNFQLDVFFFRLLKVATNKTNYLAFNNIY